MIWIMGVMDVKKQIQSAWLKRSVCIIFLNPNELILDYGRTLRFFFNGKFGGFFTTFLGDPRFLGGLYVVCNHQNSNSMLSIKDEFMKANYKYT